ncbi:OsmC family protein [Tianweitania sediminis]|uniref:OsmC family protein n=1 Tax=Tianweitania sediminis TaxID=1502156 RepID=A0A8J7RIB6_9HYPH|nr:OsmC family protein [Tianweitania sediminis]MBP0437736.1 OsmC family protein [Tianweitania sediminis]
MSAQGETRTATVELRNIAGTQAALGWAGGHTLVVDRPDGVAGGLGLGFNGAQMLALSLGGCFCNDLRYTAEQMGVELGAVAVSVTLTLEGEPLLARAANMQVDCRLVDGSDASAVIEAAKATCMVSNSLRKGFPVTISETVRG